MQPSLGSHSVRVGLVSAEPIRLAGLASAFDDHPAIAVVDGDMETLLADLSIQYLILDLSQSPAWMEMQFLVRRLRPEIRQVVLGPSGKDELIMRSIMAGARAYLDSNAGPRALRQAMESVMQGSIWAPRQLLSKVIDRLLTQRGVQDIASVPALTLREKQVLDLMMAARSNREIALELGIEERTVKAYVASLLRKTGAENRVALSVQATQMKQRELRGS